MAKLKNGINNTPKIIGTIICGLLILIAIGFKLGRYGKPLEMVTIVYALTWIAAVLIFIRERKQK